MALVAVAAEPLAGRAPQVGDVLMIRTDPDQLVSIRNEPDVALHAAEEYEVEQGARPCLRAAAPALCRAAGSSRVVWEHVDASQVALRQLLAELESNGFG